jgi:hypothetical protein
VIVDDEEMKKRMYRVDEVAVGNVELAFDDAKSLPYDAFMVKVEVNKGYMSGNTFYKL